METYYDDHRKPSMKICEITETTTEITIIYHTTRTIEINNEIGTVIIEMNHEERNTTRKETRRHISLEAYDLSRERLEATDNSRLKGARLVTSVEPNEGMRLNEGLLKQLTGDDMITARKLYGDEFEYRPEFKLWVATNHKPTIRGTDVGIWRRIHIIPFIFLYFLLLL